MSCPLIDCHMHPDWHAHDLTAALANMDAQGIEKAWLLPWECPADEAAPYNTMVMTGPLLGGAFGPIAFSRVLSWCERAPDRFIPGYSPDLRRPDAVDNLKAAVSVYGVKVCGELKLRCCYDNPDLRRAFRYCGEVGLPVLFHLDYEFDQGSPYPRPNWWYGGGIEAVARALAACPDTVFIGHGPGFWAHLSGDDRYDKEAYPTGPVLPGGRVPELLAAHGNLYCDTSAGSGCNALGRDLDFSRAFLAEFQDRVVFGRDMWDERHLKLLADLALPEPVATKIRRGNALRLLGMDGGVR